MSNETDKNGDLTASSAGDPSTAAPQIREMTFENTKMSTAPLNWKKVWYTYMKGMIRVGRWANEHKHAAAKILDRTTLYLDVERTYRGIKHIDMVPNLSPQNLASVEIGKDFMLSHAYIKNDFGVHQWAAPEFLEQAAKELINERWEKVTGDKLPTASTARLG